MVKLELDEDAAYIVRDALTLFCWEAKKGNFREEEKIARDIKSQIDDQISE